jgi:Holliday junction resolvase RusA-like endonuclease
MTVPVSFRVLGVPAPQGSKTVFNGRPVEGTSAVGRAKHRTWRADVAWAARAAWGSRPPIDEPCVVAVRFVLPRPRAARKADTWQAKKPDADKLARSLLDSLTEAGVLVDDARVSVLSVQKRLADREDPWTGATISISTLAELEETSAGWSVTPAKDRNGNYIGR